MVLHVFKAHISLNFFAVLNLNAGILLLIEAQGLYFSGFHCPSKFQGWDFVSHFDGNSEFNKLVLSEQGNRLYGM